MLRTAREDDLTSMLEWRNQTTNREVSNHQGVITPEEHARWWSAVRDDPEREVLVLEIDNSPCGVVAFFNVRSDGVRRRGSWGFYLDHDGLAENGAALVAWQVVMREALAHAFGALGLDVLEAEVLEHNAAVRSTNRRFGFVEGEVERREVDGSPRSVVPVVLTAEDHAARTARRS
ncbi:MAG: GNAT family N-acetyltransferase [Nocardioidaceae bacterium]|nr:GNAT family N-acetyltransferase [Nocardioidaceae bacterium]NUS49784.1 GNAT family N-acetyltransferase [Nocardioidaceae bacterium]